MERFTLKSYNDKYIIPSGHLSVDGELAQKLGAWEDTEEQNRLIMLPPVKPKDAVWYPWCGKVTKDYVSCFMFTSQGDSVICFSGRDGVPFDDIGKTVFLTEAEARSALRERQG